MNEETGKKIEFLRWWKETSLVVSVEHPEQDCASEAWNHQQAKIDKLKKDAEQFELFMDEAIKDRDLYKKQSEEKQQMINDILFGQS